MAQERYLSPREILSYLCDLEKKLPKRDYRMYCPSHHHDFGDVTPEEMNDECQKMLEFAGLNDCTSKAQFSQLDSETAGNTIPGHTPGGVVEINISNSIKNNWKAILATLAHEICHQVIYRYGIRPEKMNWMVEIYTDLCTIYVGFGQLILDGYNTNTGGKKHILGYLDWNTYEVTNHMVNVVCGGVHSSNTGLSGSDVYADEAIDRWEKEPDKMFLIKDTFKSLSAPIAELQRNIGLVEQLIGFYREELKTYAEKYDKTFFPDTATSGSISTNPLSAFRCIYDATIDMQSDSLFLKKINSYEETVESALYHLYLRLKESRRVVFSNDFVCPSCGKRHKGHYAEEEIKIIKCSCGIHFVLDTAHWNLTKQQRRENLRDREIQKNAVAEYERKYATFPWWVKMITKKYFKTMNNK